MNLLRAGLNTILASTGGAIAGGAAAGAAMMAVTGFPGSWAPLALGFYLWAIFTMAVLGLVGGIVFGFIPTLLLGTFLSLIRRRWPFNSLLLWAMAGAVAGLAIHFWGPFGRPTSVMTANQIGAWGTGWAVGGAVAMSVYWTAADIFSSSTWRAS